MPPIAPIPTMLPFRGHGFTWDTFESFFCDFLDSRPLIPLRDGSEERVTSARPYGRKGDKQLGIDIEAKIESGDPWVFQCKHCEEFRPADAKAVVAKCEYLAPHKFVLVTCEVSPKCRQVIEQHADWELWDARDISRHFLNPKRLPPLDAAQLLYRHFGKGWSEVLLKLSGAGPLIGAEAKFAPFVTDTDRYFHHRLALVGRTEWLKQLDEFVSAEAARVFLLRGRGGLGKSRLLYEWSKRFTSRNPDVTLYFLSDQPGDYGPALDAASKPLLLVLDDAHRLDEVRRALFSEAARRPVVKLVLALRPGPTAQMKSELVDAGFDVVHIQEPPELARLSDADALTLAEEALGEELAPGFRLRLRELSRDCPLLAVLAAELLKRGELSARDFDDTVAFQTHVFEGLLREARPVETRFGETITKDFLRLLAVLAPVVTDKEFLKRTAVFLAVEPNHVTDLLAALDAVGLLLRTGAGVRITPDLLSDHLAYTACYTRGGRDTTFAERVMKHFSPEQFPKLLHHLAEAEWRAGQTNTNADSVVEPLWTWFADRFERSAFLDRSEQLNQWSNIAHLQPRRTLELAELALRLTEAPPAELPWESKWNSHQHVLDGLSAVLRPVAEMHPEYVERCLDVLWQIGRDRPPTQHNSENHPMAPSDRSPAFNRGSRLSCQRPCWDGLRTCCEATNGCTSRTSPAGFFRRC